MTRYASPILVALALISCSRETPENQEVAYDNTPYALNTGDLTPPQLPPDNPLTVQGVKLGRMLFYEKKLSANGTQSCGSCHRQEHAFTDTARFSTGVAGFFGKRQAMAVFNTAWQHNEFFWDGRAHLLRDQSLMPIQDSLEMAETLENVVAKLQAETEYRNQFVRAFGSDEITPFRISLALEQFMNSITSVNSKYDRYLAGTAALTPEEERGRQLFFAEFNPAFPASSGADCAHCHTGRTFENDSYMNNGLDADGEFTDIGRESVTGNPADKGKFKVPSLRNAAVTGPYMHDGRFATLEEVVRHYNTGLKASATLDPTLQYPLSEGGLMLSEQDISDLLAFLQTLTDDDLLTDPAYSDPF